MRYGFRIDGYFDLEGWKVVDLTGVPITQVPACPGDGTELTPICTFRSAKDRMRLRVGCCAACGHISYIDRPTEEWIYAYYLDTWDSASERGSAEGMAAVADKAARAVEQAREALEDAKGALDEAERDRKTAEKARDAAARRAEASQAALEEARAALKKLR